MTKPAPSSKPNNYRFDTALLASSLLYAGPWPDGHYDDLSQLTAEQTSLLIQYQSLPELDRKEVRDWLYEGLEKKLPVEEARNLYGTISFVNFAVNPEPVETVQRESSTELDSFAEDVTVLEVVAVAGIVVAFLAGVATTIRWIRKQPRKPNR